VFAVWNPPLSLTSPASINGQVTLDMSRHPRFADSFLSLDDSVYMMKPAPIHVRRPGID
jgi:hypothetical protein